MGNQRYERIDIDVPGDKRDRVYQYIIDRFGQEKTGFILAMGTDSDKGVIDDVGRAFNIKWEEENLINIKELRAKRKEAKNNKALCNELDQQINDAKIQNAIKAEISPYSLAKISKIKKEYDNNPEETKQRYPEIFYYFDGLLNVKVSQSIHPAGIVASPITLPDHYGTFISDGKTVLQLDMEDVHESGLVKYDILGLKNIQIIDDTYKLLNKPYPKSHEIDWNDQKVWEDMLRSPVGIFQMESQFAFSMLSTFKPKSIFDMSMVTAAIRPSGESYRDDLMAHKPHKNPSDIIDKLLADNNGYLIYQEDVIAFLTQICGFSGSKADNTRRAIGRKDEERLNAALPEILEGYCNTSNQPREIAEEEAKEFVQIISDASSYMFGKNHSIGYCMIGYLCAYLRYYHPFEFITAYLNNANTDVDIKNGSALADLYGIKIVSPEFGVSKASYMYDKKTQVIAKGISSIKFMNTEVADKLYEAGQVEYNSFIELLYAINGIANTRQLDILIKLNFFKKYGEINHLLEINRCFVAFKNGTARSLNDQMLTIMVKCGLNNKQQYATNLNKNGKEVKTWTLTNLQALLLNIESKIQASLTIKNATFKEIMEWQKEFLGYVDITTNKIEDQYKLVITEIKPLIGKFSPDPWTYRLETRSICTGKTAAIYLDASCYNSTTTKDEKGKERKLKVMDIIESQKLICNKKGYWTLYSFKFVN